MSLQSTVPIVYSPGSYGTYLEWALVSLTSTDPVANSVTATGSSHRYAGHGGNYIHRWKPESPTQEFYHRPDYDWSQGYPKFVRLHPKITTQDSVDKTLETLLNDVDQIVYLYPNKDCVLLTINNMYYKIWGNWWEHHVNNVFNKDDLYGRWGLDLTVSADQIPNWIKREFLSFYLMPSWLDQVNWYHLDRWSNQRCHVVLVNDLLYNFENTLQRLQKLLNLDFCHSVESLLPIHQKNIKAQRYLSQDSICTQIVTSTVNGTLYDWSNQMITLPSEAWVQWQLRNLGFEIRCDGLDIFPTNSLQLKELLYPL
jgi:hypothetical protein